MVRRGGGTNTMAEPGRRCGQYQSVDRAESVPWNETVVRRSATATGMAVVEEINDSLSKVTGMSHP